MTLSSESEVRVRSNVQMAKQRLEEALRNVKEAVSELAEVQDLVIQEVTRMDAYAPLAAGSRTKFRGLDESARMEEPLRERIAVLSDLLTPVLPKKGDPVHDTCWKCGSVGRLTVAECHPCEKADFDRGMGREAALLITERCSHCGHDREYPVPLDAFGQLAMFH